MAFKIDPAHSDYIKKEFSKQVDIFQLFLHDNIEVLQKFYNTNFKDSKDKPLIYLQSTLPELVRINSACQNEDLTLWDKYIKYIPQSEVPKLSIPEKDKEFIKKFEGRIVVCHVVVIELKGFKSTLVKTYLAHKQEDDTPKQISISHNEEQGFEKDKEKRAKWIEELRKMIISKTGSKEDLKFPKEIEESFKVFIEEFKFSQKVLLINNVYVTIWPEDHQ